MKKPLVIATDIDNTLVPKHQGLSTDTIETIIRLRNDGIYFGIASGRPSNELETMLERWKTLGIENDFIIASNGCVLIDNVDKKEYQYYFMKPEQIKMCIDLMKPFNCNPCTSFDNESWCGYYDEFVGLSAQYLGKPLRVCESDDYHELWSTEVGKVLFRIPDPEMMPEIEEYVSKHPIKGLTGFKTNPYAFEFTDERANKGIALKNFCELHNIDISDAWAFGDTSNDNDMIKIAGVGICLLNGTDDTKACADYITELDVEHDGFADFIGKHIYRNK